MSRPHSRRALLRAVGTGALAGLAGCSSGLLGGNDLERAREALSDYEDVGRAVEDGYGMSFPYVHTDAGVLGMLFVDYDAPELAPDHPNVLLYNLREDGTFAPLGAKWFVSTRTIEEPPSLFGQEFRGPTPGETFDIPEHYGLHAWLFEDNPEGTFAPYHTGVEPPSYVEELSDVWEALTPFHANEERAFDEGYADTDDCYSTADGDYGVPLVNTDRTGTDPAAPAVLLYRFGSNWSYNLQGIEWYVPAEAVAEPPSMFGQQFHEPLEGHSPAFESDEHYGLHAWLFTANPDGMFARYNPRELC